jgi:hypothetical protein
LGNNGIKQPEVEPMKHKFRDMTALLDHATAFLLALPPALEALAWFVDQFAK